MRLVILHGLPRNLSDLLQQAGRAGRDGEPAMAIVLKIPSDSSSVDPKVVAVVDAEDCHRSSLLRPFGQVHDIPKDLCCNFCQPKGALIVQPMVEVTSPEKKRARGPNGLSQELAALRQDSPGACIFRPKESILSLHEISEIVKRWETIKTKEDLSFLRRKNLPAGILEILASHQEKARSRQGTSGPSPKKARVEIPSDLLKEFHIPMGNKQGRKGGKEKEKEGKGKGKGKKGK